MEENNIDNSHQMMYNQGNDDYVVVKMDEQRPINDNKCSHPILVAEPEDTIGKAIYHRCSNYKCGVGFYIQPTEI